ncbi:MAG TPA: hypothetical protein VMR43_08030 [Variovorax sp.]|nr:hypothetical protein [Variovorax sp.]
MPLDILHVLARKKLPVTVHGIRKVEAVRVLVLSGHVEAVVPVIEPSLTPSSPIAIVTRITPMGLRMLQSFPRLKAPAASKQRHRGKQNL